MTPKRIYSGLLAKPLPPVPLLRPEGDRDNLLAEKIRLLFDHYQIDRSDALRWVKLSLSLAEQHVKGFQEKRSKPGPRDKWTLQWRSRLYDDVHALIAKKKIPEEACNALAAHRDYRQRFGKRGSPPRGKTLLRIFREEENRLRQREKFYQAFGLGPGFGPSPSGLKPSLLHNPDFGKRE